ncbi:MAG: hypothetical protein GXP15_07185 [Gammaproteobacteria bacterium]|nr:hypothetical protein [Gammaproteobacteria bacterium]
MNRKRRSEIKRFASSAAIALPVTIALLYLMTRLILPGEHDRIVTRMIQAIELRRDIRPPEPADTLVPEVPEVVEKKPPPVAADVVAEGPELASDDDAPADADSKKEERTQGIDWLAEARKLTEESDKKALKRWLLEQGYERYVSSMQGDLPITNGVRARLPPTQEDVTGYVNNFGDLEYKISENCVATTQVAARLDNSDFARALPMIISCKRRKKQVYSFDRDAPE